MDDDVRIDFMTETDIEQVLGIELQSFTDPWPEEVFRAELRHSWSNCVVLRKSDPGGLGADGPEHVVGYLVFWSVADEVHLLNVAIDPKERHHQLASRLMGHLREFAVDHTARFITLEVRRSNDAAIHLYENSGFKPVGVRPRYYANNDEDAIVMLHDLGSTSHVGPLPEKTDTQADF
ncbi:MAG: ribosomal-protein-alanine N-acetyltransferase [Myxococcota bacterium]|jgi:ribosomal-protein-alanine N-acetyltransferase